MCLTGAARKPAPDANAIRPLLFVMVLPGSS